MNPLPEKSRMDTNNTNYMNGRIRINSCNSSIRVIRDKYDYKDP
jgi:hypothetical protein